MRIVRLGVAVLVALVLALGLVVTVSGTAQAATPECRATTHMHEGNEYNEVPTATPNDWVWRCVLRQGAGYDGGDQVRAVWVLQRALIQCYGQGNINADGLYGPATKAALENAQRFHNAVNNAGLVVDGIYGPATAAQLEFVNSDNECWTLS